MGPNGEGRRTPPPSSGVPAHPASERGPSPVPGHRDPGVEVRPATDADAPACAALHAGQISQGFLSFLGPGFLRRLYRRINRSPHSFLLIAAEPGATVGFIAGSTDVAGLYRSFLWHDGVPAAVQAAGTPVSGWRRVLDTLGHATSGGAGVGRGRELLAVAVDPAWQGRGVGRMLVAAFLDEVVGRGWTPPMWWSGRTTAAPSPSTSGPGSSPPNASSSTPAPSPCSCSGTADPVHRRPMPVRGERSSDRRRRLGGHPGGHAPDDRGGQATGIVDRPGALKPQAEPVPYLGGVAVLAGAAVGVAAGRPTVIVPLAAALVPGGGRRPIRPAGPVRLVGQVAVGVAVVVTCPVHLPAVAGRARAYRRSPSWSSTA